MKTAVIYARFSSDKQTEQSIEGQLHVCEDYAKRNNIIIVDTYIDRAMTGTNDNRHSFQRMLKDSTKRAWNIVLVYKLDRFSRNKYEMAMHKRTLKDNGIKLVSAMENIPDTPEGIILESLLEGMAEYYSAELSQKVKRGMRETRQKGNFLGGHLIYGYKVEGKKIVIDEDKAAIVRYIFEEYAKNVFVKDIIVTLTEKGILNRGKPFAKNTVYKMLANEKYIGIYRYKDEIFTNMYPRIIPQELFEKVASKITANRHGSQSNGTIFLLRKKMICGYCGKGIAGESGTSKNGKRMYYYKCSGRKRGTKCKQEMFRKTVIEQLVIETIFKTFCNKETISQLADDILKLQEQKLKDTSVINILNEEKIRIQKSIANLVKAAEEGFATASTQKRLTELELRNEEISALILTEQTKNKVNVTKDEIIDFVMKALKKEPQQMIQQLIKNIVVYNDKIEITFNYTNRKSPDGDDNRRGFCFCTSEKIVPCNDNHTEIYEKSVGVVLFF